LTSLHVLLYGFTTYASVPALPFAGIPSEMAVPLLLSFMLLLALLLLQAVMLLLSSLLLLGVTVFGCILAGLLLYKIVNAISVSLDRDDH
jgi:hypothetical protein